MINPMTSGLTAFLRGLAVTLVGIAALSAAPVYAADKDKDDDELRHFSTRSGLHFYAGGEVDVTAPADTVFAAGGEVTVNSKDVGEIIAAGGDVDITDVVTNRVIAAGGEVSISGAITKSLIAAGGSVDVQPGTKVGGDVILGGGEINFNGEVGGDFLAAGGNITLGGRLDGDVTLRSPDIDFMPGTRIGGNLSYSSPSELKIPAGVEIAGTVTRTVWEEGKGWSGDFGIGKIIAVTVAAVAFGVVALFLFAGVVLAFFARQVDGAATIVTDRPLQSLGLGVLLAVVLPVTVLMLVITIIGIPLGLFILAAYGVLFGMGVVVAAYWIGEKLRMAMTDRQDRPRYFPMLGWTLLGLVIFAFVGLIPFVGTLAQFFALVTGFGAFVLALTAANAAPVAPSAV